jgi:hypothetical protein
MTERYGTRTRKRTVQFRRKGVVGVIEWSKGHPPQLAVTPSRTDLAEAEARLSISLSSSRARCGGGCLLDIALTPRFPMGEEVGAGPYLDRPQKARGRYT